VSKLTLTPGPFPDASGETRADGAATGAARTLLIEIRTEELPPKALSRLGIAFAESLRADLSRDGLLDTATELQWFATPRRLAVQLTRVARVAADKPIEMQGPSVKAGLNAEGAATPALQGFARKCGVAVEALEQTDTPKGRVFIYRGVARGVALDDVLPAKVAASLKALPIPKVMRWGSGDAEFVRPAHGLMMLHGSRVIPGTVLGLESGNTTLGHRFLSAGPITIAGADEYEQIMRDEGRVVVSFAARRAAIAEALVAAAGESATFEKDDALLDEVTALTEAPVVYKGEYSPDFLEVPHECLVLSMKQHQKYFPLTHRETGRLVARFLVVSNLETADPRNIIHGNERVLRARLADARFFYDQDRKTPLETRVPLLANVVYHNRLGTQLQRVERVAALAVEYAQALGQETESVERAARLAKADLLTGMVGEFPELQGIMGRYYALHDGEAPHVADAIESHYRPRYAGDAVPASEVGATVALADKLEILTGLFGIGQPPTGDKDPYGLRRQAIGVVRILAERSVPLDLTRLVGDAFGVFDSSFKLKAAQGELMAFFFDRMRGYFAEGGYSSGEIDAVLALLPGRVDLIPLKLKAVRMFNGLPEAPSLAAANKRIGNILKKTAAASRRFDPALMTEDAEKSLFGAYSAIRATADERFAVQDYEGVLKALAGLRQPVDGFFDSVMVMADDVNVRDNRLALLAELQETMNRVADISRLAA
jgi:glycyl-tRNA synthetase beta chain